MLTNIRELYQVGNLTCQAERLLTNIEHQPENQYLSPQCPTQPCLVPGENSVKTLIAEEKDQIEYKNLTGSHKLSKNLLETEKPLNAQIDFRIR